MAKDASALREIRTRLGLSQAGCATALGVALETFRTWDAGRRPTPEAIVSEARAISQDLQGHSIMQGRLRLLAPLLGIEWAF